MNKEKFLMQLRERLSILENQEQEDILAEYAQHIDMKMDKGQNEEEAIRDFGSMEELAAQILEAYHVKPEFRKKSATLRLPVQRAGGADGGETMAGRMVRWLKGLAAGAVSGVKRGFGWIGEKCSRFAAWAMKPFTGRKLKAEEEAMWESGDRDQMEQARTADGQNRNFLRMMGRGIAVAWRWCVDSCILCLKLMWNIGWVLFALFCTCLAMVMLMGIGAMPVFIFQGYPFIGIFLICLGGLLCLAALIAGAFSILFRKKKDDGADVKKPGEEAVYEQTA